MKVEKPVPCVIYLHGNSGSRIDADDIVDSYLAEHIAVFSIDFGGCGLSEGDFVTLGWRERDDLECVLDYLSGDKNTACIALFGRSMGAATALLVASDDRYYHMVRGMVLDSCYTSVRQVLQELAHKYVGKVPLVPFASMVDKAVDLLREAVLQRAGFDLDAVNVIQAARHCSSPVLFGHADDDQLVLASHTRNLFAEYGGQKTINVFEGDHNSIRPKEFQEQALVFLQECFKDAMKEAEQQQQEAEELQKQQQQQEREREEEAELAARAAVVGASAGDGGPVAREAGPPVPGESSPSRSAARARAPEEAEAAGAVAASPALWGLGGDNVPWGKLLVLGLGVLAAALLVWGWWPGLFRGFAPARPAPRPPPPPAPEPRGGRVWFKKAKAGFGKWVAGMYKANRKGELDDRREM